MTDTAIIDDPNFDVLGGVIEAYRREGFDAGYQRATQDLLACLVLSSEQFLCEQASSGQELRRVLYAFVDRLERQLDRNAQAHGYVEGGLGI